MKIKAFLIIGVSAALVGQAYLWSNDTSYSEQYDKTVESIKNYAVDKKNQAVESTTTYVRDKKNEAVSSVKSTIKHGFDTSISKITGKPIPTPDSSAKDTSKDNKETSAPKEEPKKTETTVKKEFPKPEALYELKFKYDPTGAPENISEKEFLALVKKASNIWEESCGIRFTYDGNTRSDYIGAGRTTRKDYALIRWSELDDAIGQAHQGSHRQPAYDFVMDLNQNHYNTHTVDTESLLAVLVHELGHTIGLDHSRLPGSVMHFQQVTVESRLNEGDTKMCQDLTSTWASNPVNKKHRI